MKSKKAKDRYKVSAKAVRQLLQDPQWSLDEDLTGKMPSGTVYVHPDGRILDVFRDGTGGVYTSLEAMTPLLQSLEEMKQRGGKPKHC